MLKFSRMNKVSWVSGIDLHAVFWLIILRGATKLNKSIRFFSLLMSCQTHLYESKTSDLSLKLKQLKLRLYRPFPIPRFFSRQQKLTNTSQIALLDAATRAGTRRVAVVFCRAKPEYKIIQCFSRENRKGDWAKSIQQRSEKTGAP